MLVHLTMNSMNKKTMYMPTSTSDKKTCSNTCPWKAKGCYANHGPEFLHWSKVSNGSRGIDYKEFLKKISCLPKFQLWRHNQAGDLAGLNNTIDSKKLMALVKANKGKRGYTYTHKPVSEATRQAQKNKALVKYANQNGFTVNLSADNLKHADQLYDLNVGPVCVIVPLNSPKVLYTPKGRKVNLCPNAYNEKITCHNCGICAIPNRKNIIGFIAHGTAKKHVSENCKG